MFWLAPVAPDCGCAKPRMRSPAAALTAVTGVIWPHNGMAPPKRTAASTAERKCTFVFIRKIWRDGPRYTSIRARVFGVENGGDRNPHHESAHACAGSISGAGSRSPEAPLPQSLRQRRASPPHTQIGRPHQPAQPIVPMERKDFSGNNSPHRSANRQNDVQVVRDFQCKEGSSISTDFARKSTCPEVTFAQRLAECPV